MRTPHPGWIGVGPRAALLALALLLVGLAPSATAASPLPMTVAQAGNCAARNNCIASCQARRASCLTICRQRSTARRSGCEAHTGCADKYRSCAYACSQRPPAQQAGCRSACALNRSTCQRSCVQTVRPSNCSARCGGSCAASCPPC